MAELSKLFVVIGARTAEFSKGMDKVEGRLEKFSNKFKILGGVLAGATMAIGVGSLKMAADFDSAMRRVNTMMLLGEDEFGEFKKEIREFSREMGVKAVDSANALYQAISAGVPKENVIDFLTVATKAAIGGTTDTIVAVDGLTTVINAFGRPMSDVTEISDTLFAIVAGGKTTFEELSASMFNVAPIANTMGVEFETVAAALATMTQQGTPTAQATTQLRQAMVSLAKPTAEMQAVIGALGYESSQTMLAELGFIDTINTLRDATAGNNEQLMKMFGSVEAGSAIMALTGEKAIDFSKSVDAIGNSAGATEAAFQQIEETAPRTFADLTVNLQDLALTIGDALLPPLQQLVKAVTPIVTKIGEWMAEHEKLAAGILVGVGALGAMLLTIGPLVKLFGVMKGLIVAVAGVTKVAAAAQWLLNAAMSANPIGIVIVAVAGLVAGIIALHKHWDAVTAFFRRAWEKIKQFFLRGALFILDSLSLITRFIPGLNDKVDSARQHLRDMIDGAEVERDVQDVIGSLQTMTAATETELDKQTEAVRDAIDEQREIQKTAHEERMDELQAEYDAATKLIDDAANKEIDEIDDKIEAIDDLQREKDRAREDEEDAEKQARLEEAVADARGISEKKDAQQDLDNFLADLEDQALQRQKEDLREHQEDIRRRAELEKANLAATLEADQALEDEKFAAIMAPYELAEQELILWHQREQARIQQTIASWHGTALDIPATPSPERTLELLNPTKMASGGILRKPTLALLGDSGPEAVIPLGKGTIGEHDLAALSRGTSAQGNVVININPGILMANETELRMFTRKIHKVLREENRTRTVGITV